MFITGDAIHRPPIRSRSLVPTTSIDYDTITWCVRRAQPVPKWQNIFFIFKNIYICLFCVILYYTVVITAYFVVGIENMTYDSYTIMLKVLQSLFNTPIQFNVKKSSVRFLFMFHLWGCMFAYLIVISFYVVFINLSIDGHQLTTKLELIQQGFRVAGGQYALKLITDYEIVILCFF